MAQPITYLNPTTLPDASAMGHSQITIAEAGRTAYISGQVAWQANGKPVPATLAGQTEVVVANSRAALEAIGATGKDIVMARLFITGGILPNTAGIVMPQIIELFDGGKPSITAIGVLNLAGPDLLLELEMTVRLPA
ncbi:RidA family protein [Kordiimonas pumila]|uniref:RidA family protein n=1 Tax=Kordiimonas pumila TaxID=2161677 RepID=A0ABV7D993_9PROT|nr:RidA family protein [Kordiimonas pumila]